MRTGKVLGGSSVTNDMKYTRGHRRDYDAWHNPGHIASLDWQFDNLLEHFKSFEDNGTIQRYLHDSYSIEITLINSIATYNVKHNVSTFDCTETSR